MIAKAKSLIVGGSLLFFLNPVLAVEQRLDGRLHPYDMSGPVEWDEDFRVRLLPADTNCVHAPPEELVDYEFFWSATVSLSGQECDKRLTIRGAYKDFYTFPEDLELDLEEGVVLNRIEVRLYSPARSLEEAYSNATKDHRRKRYDSSEKWYRRALSFGKKSKIYRGLVDLAREQNDFVGCAEAAEEWEQWSRESSGDPLAAMREKARCLVKLAEIEASLSTWEQVAEESRNFLSTWVNLGESEVVESGSELVGYWLDSLLMRAGAESGDYRLLALVLHSDSSLLSEWRGLHEYFGRGADPMAASEPPVGDVVTPEELLRQLCRMAEGIGRSC